MNFVIGVFFWCLALCGMAQLTPKQYEQIKDISGKCAAELDITLDESFLKPGPYDGILFDDERKNKLFIACFLSKMGAVSPDGTILSSKLLEFMAEGNVTAELRDTINKCATAEGDSLEDRAFNFHACYWTERKGNISA